MTYKYANTRIDKTGFPLDKDHLLAIKELKKNKDVVISRPDKGHGVVVMDKQDYVRKTNDILPDEDKFQRLGTAEKNDNTILQERAFQAFLLRHQKVGHIIRE